MYNWLLTLWMLMKVIVIFTIVFVILPCWIIRFEEEREHPLDKLFIGITITTLITIITVHLLAFIKLYEFASLVVSFFAIYIIIVKIQDKSRILTLDKASLKLIVKSLEIADSSMESFYGSMKKIKRWLEMRMSTCRMFVIKALREPLYILLPVLVMCAAAYIRFKHSINYFRFSHIDVYAQLLNIKYLSANEIYHSGVYPYGYYTVISALSKLAFMDPYWVSRFIGPLGGTLMVLSVYYAALKFTGSRAASLISLVIYGLVTKADFPSVAFRQAAALPQEFGAIFVLPGLYYLWAYIKTQKKFYLCIFLQAFAVTLLVHQYVALFLVMLSAILLGVSFILFRLKSTCLIETIVYSAGTGLASLIPIGLGLISGKQFHKTSIEMVEQGSDFRSILTVLREYGDINIFSQSIFLAIIIPIALVMIMSIFFIRKNDNKALILTIVVTTLILYLVYQVSNSIPDDILPELLTTGRLGVFFALVLAIFYALGFAHIEMGISVIFKKIGSVIASKVAISFAALSICSAVVYFYPPVVLYSASELYSGSEEYEAAIINYLKIKTRYLPLDWTIIAPFEQLTEAYGYGRHTEIINFVKGVKIDQARDPSFHITIPTHHIFIYTEKRPLHFGREITVEDSEKDLEPQSDDPYMQYYKNPAQRAIMEAKAINWLETYAKYHSDITVFYEDKDMKIYHIYNPDPDKLLKKTENNR